jgi:hypothetical protein
MEWLGVILIVLCVCLCCNEQKKLEQTSPPKTVEEAKAQAVKEGDIKIAVEKAKGIAKMENIRMYCAIGAIASIFAFIMGTSGIKAFAIAGFIASIAGGCLAQLNIDYPIWYVYGGLILLSIAVLYAVFLIIKELILTVEKTKVALPTKDKLELFGGDVVSSDDKIEQVDGTIKTDVQSPSTTRVVKLIRKVAKIK